VIGCYSGYYIPGKTDLKQEFSLPINVSKTRPSLTYQKLCKILNLHQEINNVSVDIDIMNEDSKLKVGQSMV
jgi:hypothetical protein